MVIAGAQEAECGMATEFRLLGDIEVNVDGRAVGAGHARRRCVLAVLAAGANRVVLVDELIDRVWGDQRLPGDPRNAVHTYISLLRRALGAAGDAGITLQAGGYRLAADAATIDMHRFGALVSRARAGADDAHAAALLQEALGLWRGEPFAHLDTPWINAARSALAATRRAAQLELIDAQLRLGQHAAAVARLSELVAAHPLDEGLAGQYIVALYRSGRRSAALAHYWRLQQHLAGELGIGPGPALRFVHEQVHREDPALGPAAPGPTPPVTVREEPRQLPMDVAGFTGRDCSLAGLDLLLPLATGTQEGSQQAGEKPPAPMIAVVSGTAGAGKTALAVHWAHQVAGRFPDGQLYVNLRGYDPGRPATAGEALGGFLRALGVASRDIPASTAERAARFRSLLASRRMLILLDNASQTEQVRPLLPGNPACVTLVTSRSWLTGLGARDGAVRLDLDVLPAGEAAGLLSTLIGPRADARPGLLSTLAERCARLPLALRVAAELAAADPAVPLAQLADDLADQERRLDVLTAGEDPQTALRAVFSWSVRQLDHSTLRMFRLAGLHPGPDVSAAEAAELADVTVDHAACTLAHLARVSLMRTVAPGRYAMHDLLRAYARELGPAAAGPAGGSAIMRPGHAARSRLSRACLASGPPR
jgi:DNA-binding SARP family transcriptional activator